VRAITTHASGTRSLFATKARAELDTAGIAQRRGFYGLPFFVKQRAHKMRCGLLSLINTRL
jgi:hypothetical protein